MRMYLLHLLLLLPSWVIGQAGLAVSPSRLYYEVSPGGSARQFISVTNPGESPLEVGVSVNDWYYDRLGTNQIAAPNTLVHSCSDWLQIFPGTYFVVPAKGTTEVEVSFKVPVNAASEPPVHTAIIFFTQLNPAKPVGSNGAAIQVTVKSGVKIYHKHQGHSVPVLEVTNFKGNHDADNNFIAELEFENQGTVWGDGKIKWELFNTADASRKNLGESQFFTLPGDKRAVLLKLPKDLPGGNYILSAVMAFGQDSVIKVSELEFQL
ncbi:hypothetical protein [Flavobacterium sp. AG291]|uniref:hypothetical protein n=1 Tax=Flavobacterium sp. AG291 TaxID=2184000 RepID=UPI000E2D012F|nr:hypothetical protein [Flavobacterium sp. AG291]RDI11214.1 hypothetical protein DEU42_106148 [Flavobacterium sp. AG291]